MSVSSLWYSHGHYDTSASLILFERDSERNLKSHLIIVHSASTSISYLNNSVLSVPPEHGVVHQLPSPSAQADSKFQSTSDIGLNTDSVLPEDG